MNDPVYSKVAEDWLRQLSDRERARRIDEWVIAAFGGDEINVEAVELPRLVPGIAQNVSEIAAEGVALCWFEACPFATVKVMWFSELDDLELS
jgi:hypothetical protein